MNASPLPCRLMETDQHFVPLHDAHERSIDPLQREKAVRTVRGPDGQWETLYAGRPMRMSPKNFQVAFGDDLMGEIRLEGAGVDGEIDRDIGKTISGWLLSRLNPLRSLGSAGRKDFVRRYRELHPLLENPADRLSVMDDHGIEATVNFAGRWASRTDAFCPTIRPTDLERRAPCVCKIW